MLVLLAGLFAGITFRGIYPFLSIDDPLPGGALVVEGWAPDRAMEFVAAEFRRQHYDKVYVIGGPLDSGAPLSEYQTYAQLGAAVLLKLGLSTNDVQAVPAPHVRKDRTYAAVMSLRDWWRQHGPTPTKVHLISEGPHSRRSRLMMQKALGKGVAVGVTAAPCAEFDGRDWYRCSAGVRAVISEGLAYLYARFLFYPPKEGLGPTGSEAGRGG